MLVGGDLPTHIEVKSPFHDLASDSRGVMASRLVPAELGQRNRPATTDGLVRLERPNRWDSFAPAHEQLPGVTQCNAGADLSLSYQAIADSVGGEQIHHQRCARTNLVVNIALELDLDQLLHPASLDREVGDMGFVFAPLTVVEDHRLLGEPGHTGASIEDHRLLGFQHRFAMNRSLQLDRWHLGDGTRRATVNNAPDPHFATPWQSGG